MYDSDFNIFSCVKYIAGQNSLEICNYGILSAKLYSFLTVRISIFKFNEIISYWNGLDHFKPSSHIPTTNMYIIYYEEAIIIITQ